MRREALSNRQSFGLQPIVFHGKAAVLAQLRDKVARLVLDAVGADLAAEAVALVPQQRLVAAQDSRAALAQTLENFELRLADALARAEKLDVRGAMLVITA